MLAHRRCAWTKYTSLPVILLFALDHTSCVRSCEHGILVRRASRRCARRTSASLLTIERVGTCWGCRRNSFYGCLDLDRVAFVSFPIFLSVRTRIVRAVVRLDIAVDVLNV